MTSTFGSQNIGFKEIKDGFNIPDGEIKSNELDNFNEIFDPPYTNHSSTYISSSSIGNSSETRGRLSETDDNTAWEIRDSTNAIVSNLSGNTTNYWQINISENGIESKIVKGVVIKGKKDSSASDKNCISKLKLKYSSNNSQWNWVDNGYEFTGNYDNDTSRYILFNEPVVATGIRFFPTDDVDSPAMRMALLLDHSLYSSATKLSEPFYDGELLDIEWGFRKGFGSIYINNKIHSLIANDKDGGTNSWNGNFLISKTSYPVENNIYELSLKHVDNYVNSANMYYFSVEFNNEVGSNDLGSAYETSYQYNLSNYKLVCNTSGVVSNWWDNNPSSDVANFGTVSNNVYSKIIVDGINGKVHFVVNDVLQTTKEYVLEPSEKTGKFYVKVVGYSGKAVLRLRKLNNFTPITNIFQEQYEELDIAWGYIKSYTTSIIQLDGREKVHQLVGTDSSGWEKNGVVSSESYVIKDNIYILSLKKSGSNYVFFGIDLTASTSASNLHNMKYTVYHHSNNVARTRHYYSSTSHEGEEPLTTVNNNTWVDMIINGVSQKIQFVVNGVLQSYEWDMDSEDLTSSFYVKVDSNSAGTSYLSLRKLNYFQDINISNETPNVNVSGISIKGISDYTYLNNFALKKFSNKFELNNEYTGKGIYYNSDELINNLNNDNSEAYFVSRQKIDYNSEIKQGIQFKLINNWGTGIKIGLGKDNTSAIGNNDHIFNQQKVLWNIENSGTSVQFNEDGSIESTVNNTRTEAFFISDHKIFYNADKTCIIRFKCLKSGSSNNLIFGVGKTKYFSVRTHETGSINANPRWDINYPIYLTNNHVTIYDNPNYDDILISAPGTSTYTLSYSYTTNTVFEIRITGTTVAFYVDNVYRHSRTTTQNHFPFYIMGAMYLDGAGVKDVEVIYDSYPSDVYNYKMEVHDLSLNCYSNNRLVDTHVLTPDDFPLYFKGNFNRLNMGIKEIEMYGEWNAPITKQANSSQVVNNIDWGTPTKLTVDTTQNTIVQSENASSWNSKLKSITHIDRNDNSWQGIEFEILNSNSTDFKVGLGNADFPEDGNYSSEIEFSNLTLSSISTKYRVLVKGNTIRYIEDDNIVQETTETTPIQYPLFIKITGNETSGNGLKNLKLLTKDAYEGIGPRWSSDIEWGTRLNMTVLNNTRVVASTEVSSWAHIKSITSIERDDSNWQGIKFQSTKNYNDTSSSTPNKYYVRLGLGNLDFVDGDITVQLTYPFYLRSNDGTNNPLEIQGNYGSNAYSAKINLEYTEDDVFQILVKGQETRYIINDVLYHTQQNSNIVYPLYIKLITISSSQGVKNLKILNTTSLRKAVFKTNSVVDPNKQMDIMFDKPELASKIRITEIPKITSNEYPYEAKLILSNRLPDGGQNIFPNNSYYTYHSTNSQYLSLSDELGSNGINNGNLNDGGIWIPNQPFLLARPRESLLDAYNSSNYSNNQPSSYGDPTLYTLGSISGIVGVPIWGWPGTSGSNAVSQIADYPQTANGGPIYKNPANESPLYVCPFNGNGHIKYSYFDIDNGNYVWVKRGHYTVSLSESEFKSYIDTIDSNHITKLFNGKLYFNSSEVSMVSFDTYNYYKLSYIRTWNGWYEIETSKNNTVNKIDGVSVNTGYLGLHFEIEFHVAVGGGFCRVSLNGSNVLYAYETYDPQGSGMPKRGINTWVFDSDGNHINNHGVLWRDMYGSSTGRANWEKWTQQVKRRNVGDIIVVSSTDYISAPGDKSAAWSFFDSYGSTVMKGTTSYGGQLPTGSRYGCCCLFIYGRPELGIYEYVSAVYQVAEPPKHVYVYKDLIKTSGRNGYMTSFKLQYKNENDQYIDLNNGSPYNFSTLPTTTVESTTEDILFEEPIFAKSVRLLPWTWDKFISAKMGLIIKNEVNIEKQFRNTVSGINNVVMKSSGKNENILENDTYFQSKEEFKLTIFDTTNFITSTHAYKGLGDGEKHIYHVPQHIKNVIDDYTIHIDTAKTGGQAVDNYDFRDLYIEKYTSNSWYLGHISSPYIKIIDISIDILESKNIQITYYGSKYNDVGTPPENWKNKLQYYYENSDTITNNTYHLCKLDIILKKKDIQLPVSTKLEKIQWDKDNDQYLTYSDNDTAIYKTNNSGSWNMYTISKTKIERNDDYWQTFTFQTSNVASNPPSYLMVGLGNTTAWNTGNTNYYQIDYIFYIRDSSSTSYSRVFEANGTSYLPNNYTGYYNLAGTKTDNDIYQIRVKGDVVQYLFNGSVVYTSTKTPTYPLYIKFNSEKSSSQSFVANTGIKNIKLHTVKLNINNGNNDNEHTITNSFKYSGRKTLKNYEKISDFPSLEPSSKIYWDIDSSIKINFNLDGSITRNTSETGGTGWYSCASALHPIYENNNMYQGIRFSANQTWGYVIVGLKTGENNFNYNNNGTTSVRYGLYINAHKNTDNTPYPTSNAIIIRESEGSSSNIKEFHEGANPNNPHSTSDGYLTNYTTDDIFEVRVIGKTVEYVFNGTVIYYSLKEAMFPLYPCIVSWGAVNNTYIDGEVGVKNISKIYEPLVDEYVQHIHWDMNNTNHMNINEDGSIESNGPWPDSGGTNRTYINSDHGNDYWPSIAMSTEKLYKSNNYQSVKFQKKTLDSGFIIGLSQHHTGSNNYEDWFNGINRYGHIDFGLIVRENGNANALEIYERKETPTSSDRFNVSYTSTSPEITLDDVFEVRVRVDKVEYLKNGVVFYTSTKVAKFPLYVRAAMNSGDGIKNIELVKLNRTSYIEEFGEKPVIWDYTSGFSINSTDTTKITKTGYNNWSSLAIARTQPIYRNDNIWQGVRCQFVSGTDYNMTGLSSTTSTSFTDGWKGIDFALYIRPTKNEIEIYESDNSDGAMRHEFSETPLTSDILEVRVRGDTVQYVKNGNVFYVSYRKPNYPLYVKSSSYNVGDGIENVKIFKEGLPSEETKNSHNNKIQWNCNAVKTIVDQHGSIIKTDTDAWDGFIMSTEKIYRNNFSYQGVRFQVGKALERLAMGLGNRYFSNASDTKSDINFGIITKDSGDIKVIENNTETSAFYNNYTEHDIFEVRVKGSTVEYLKNDVVFHTSSTDATFPLYVQASIYENGFKAQNIQLTINHPPYAAKSELSWDTINSHYIDFNSDGSITRSLSSSSSYSESRTISNQIINYDPNLIQGVRFQIKSTSDSKTMGLGVDTNWEGTHDGNRNHYNAIHFCTYVSSAKVRVYESDPTLGVSSSNASVARTNPDTNNGDFHTGATTDDIFEVRVIGRTVEYVRNGEVYHTSVNEAVFPLYVKASIQEQGFKNIELFKDRYPLRRVEWDEQYSKKVDINNLREIRRTESGNNSDYIWDSNALSIQNIKRNDNIWQGIRFQSIREEGENTCMFGLTTNTNALKIHGTNDLIHYDWNLRYAYYINPSTGDPIKIYEWDNDDLKTKNKGDYCDPLSPNDILEIRVKGEDVEYLQNGVVFRDKLTTTDEDNQINESNTTNFKVPPAIYPLYAGFSARNQSSGFPIGVKNVEFFKHVEWNRNKCKNIYINYDGSITKPSSTTNDVWETGAISKDYFLNGDKIHQGIKFKMKADSQNKTFVMVGLGNNKWHNVNDLTSSFQYGFLFKNGDDIAPGTNGLYVVEDASMNKWEHTPQYTQNSDAFNDIFEIRIKDTTVEYLKNGIVEYTSTEIPMYPLYVKVAIMQHDNVYDRGVEYIEIYSTDDLYRKCKHGDDVLWSETSNSDINFHSNFVAATTTDNKAKVRSIQNISFNSNKYQGLQFQLFNGGNGYIGLGRNYDVNIRQVIWDPTKKANVAIGTGQRSSSIEKSTTTNQWQSHAMSTQSITEDNNNWQGVKFSPNYQTSVGYNKGNGGVMIGLGTNVNNENTAENTTNTYINIQYAFFFYIYVDDWYHRIYEEGDPRGDHGTSNFEQLWDENDVFEVRVKGTTVEYLKNGSVIYTSTQPASFPLYVEATMSYKINNGLRNVEIYTSQPSPTPYNYFFPEYAFKFRPYANSYSYGIMENTGTDFNDNQHSHPWPKEGTGWGDGNMTGDLYTDDDIWEIRVLGNLVQYLRNDIVVYTSEKRIPFDSWPLHIILAAPYNSSVQTGTDNPNNQGFRNIKFINYSEGFYLTNENYFQDIKTSTTNSGVNKIEDNSTIVSWRNINDNHSIKNEDTNALKIFSNSIGFRTIDENAAKNMYRATFIDNISNTYSNEDSFIGIWFQFELSSNCKCVPAFIKMSYYNINNVPYKLFLFASNDDSVSSDIENSPKWINIKSFSLDLHNHSMVDTINKTLTFEMNHTLSYRYFRLVITKINNSDILSFYNLQLNGNVIEIN